MASTTRKWKRWLACIAGGVLAAQLLANQAVAQSAAPPVAKAVSVQGTVEAQRSGQTPWQAVRLNDTFSPGDTIRVQARSRADIALLDQSVLRLNANTTIRIETPKQGKTGLVEVYDISWKE